MLTGEAARADALVLTAFRRLSDAQRDDGVPRAAVEDGTGDLLREELVRAYLADARRHRRDRVEAPAGADAVDVLASLRPRQRAATVLMRVEGWSKERTSRALHISPRRVLSLVPMAKDMDVALESVADVNARPDREIVTDVLASLAVATPDTGSAVGGQARAGGVFQALAGAGTRDRGVRLLLAAALLAIGAVVATELLDEPDPASYDLLESVEDAGSLTTTGDLTARGWVLDAEGHPPTTLEGLRLLESTTIDYADATDPLALDTQPTHGHVVFAALWCDIPALDDSLVVPTATLALSGERVALPCAGNDGDPAVARLHPLPPPGRTRPTPVSLTWAGDLPTRGSAVLATYTETDPGAGPSTPVVLPDEPPPVPADVALLDSSSVSRQLDGVAIFVQRVSVSAQTRLSVWTGQTGAFMVLVDGVVTSDDGDLSFTQLGVPFSAGRWRDQDPELREGFLTVHAPGHVKQHALPEVTRPAQGERSEVTVAAIVDSGPENRWQVQVTDASPVDIEVSPVPESSTDAPTRVPGHRFVGAWEVPMTGYSYPLATSTSLSLDTVFTSISPSSVDVPSPGWSREGALTSDLGTVSLPSGIDQYWAMEFMQYFPGWPERVRGDSPADVESGSPLGQVSAAYLGYSSSVDHVTVLAYEPVP